MFIIQLVRKIFHCWLRQKILNSFIFYHNIMSPYRLPKSFCLTYRRDVVPKTTKLPDLGFRCVKDIE